MVNSIHLQLYGSSAQTGIDMTREREREAGHKQGGEKKSRAVIITYFQIQELSAANRDEMKVFYFFSSKIISQLK